MVVGLISFGIILIKLAPFTVVPLFIIWIRTHLICYEESLMITLFGEPYIEHKRRVRRWI
jgi:protein-S-isoprenylcysteine O-methyltransferase Ste14